jgi:hypothetical protein
MATYTRDQIDTVKGLYDMLTGTNLKLPYEEFTKRACKTMARHPYYYGKMLMLSFTFLVHPDMRNVNFNSVRGWSGISFFFYLTARELYEVATNY